MRWIIGDIHGMAKPLDALLNAIASRDAEARLYFVGDYVNRGPDSREVIDRCLAIPKGVARFVRGNHDDIFDQILSGQSYAPNASEGDRNVAFRWFLQYGLDATFTSYGADAARLAWLAEHSRNASALREVIALIPASHLAFIHALEPAIIEPDLFVVHGNWPVDETDDAMPESLSADPAKRRGVLWNRFEAADIIQPKAWRRTGYFGHTPVELYPNLLIDPTHPMPIESSKMRLLDTAVALHANGRLTAYCHETISFIQVDRKCRVLDGPT